MYNIQPFYSHYTGHSCAFSALTLLVGWQEGHLACKKYEGWWRWALVSPDGVAPSRMVGVSASVNLPLRHKAQMFSSGTDSPGWSQKKGRKTIVLCCGIQVTLHYPATPVKNWRILLEQRFILLPNCLVSDIAIFVLKRDVKLQLTNYCPTAIADGS